MLALPPVALSVDHIADIIRALIPLVPHTHPGVRLSVLETVRTVLNCRREDVIKIVKEGDGELITAVLDLTEKIDIGTPVPVAQAALNILSDISTISNVPRLVAILRSAEENNINLKLVTVAVLKDIGSGCHTEQKGELAQTHDLFATLTPLLRSPDENVSTWSSEAISAFSTAENIPLLIGFLKGEDERLKLMAIRILKDLVQVGVSEDLKLAVVNSGVLSELHRFLQKPPEQPTTVIGYLPVGDSLSSPIGPFSNPILEVQATDSLPSPNGPSPNISTQSDIDGPPSGGPPDDKQVASSEQPVDQAAAIRQPADAGTFTKVDRVIELRDSAFAILDVIATNASDNGMEIIADAYVHAGIHTALVALLNEPEHDPALPGDDPSRRNCIFVLHELARGADYVKREIIKTEIFEELKRIMDSTNGMALQWCCLMLYHLLSSDEVNEDIVLAIVNADLIERLVTSFKGDWNPVSAAQAMSCLVMSTADTTWTKLREQNAITCLQKFLQSLESVEGLFASRTWILVEYLDHPQIEAQKFGLFLVNWLLKGGISQRKSVTNTAGMRDALEGCLKSEDDEVKTQAKDLISKLPSVSRRR
ncbi:armadillo-type protein [Mycena crocata]|nr:armadillo-type protein [Mycena crocata]